jgi:hypothetical protein
MAVWLVAVEVITVLLAPANQLTQRIQGVMGQILRAEAARQKAILAQTSVQFDYVS